MLERYHLPAVLCQNAFDMRIVSPCLTSDALVGGPPVRSAKHSPLQVHPTALRREPTQPRPMGRSHSRHRCRLELATRDSNSSLSNAVQKTRQILPGSQHRCLPIVALKPAYTTYCGSVPRRSCQSHKNPSYLPKNAKKCQEMPKNSEPPTHDEVKCFLPNLRFSNLCGLRGLSVRHSARTQPYARMPNSSYPQITQI